MPFVHGVNYVAGLANTLTWSHHITILQFHKREGGRESSRKVSKKTQGQIQAFPFLSIKYYMPICTGIECVFALVAERRRLRYEDGPTRGMGTREKRGWGVGISYE